MTDVKDKDNCVAVPKMNIYAYSGKPFLYGLVLGNISASASVSASVGGNIIAGGNDLGITSANYTNYLVASDSNVALLNPVTSWYTGSAN